MQPEPKPFSAPDDQTQQLEGQLTFDIQPERISEADASDVTAQYSSEQLADLAEACGYEFSDEEMQLIYNILLRIRIPKDPETGSVSWGRIFYLQEKYAALNAAASKKSKTGVSSIRNRFKYFLRMLEEDTFRPAAFTEQADV